MNFKNILSRCAGLVLVLGLAAGHAQADVVTLAGTTIAGGSAVFSNLNGDSVNVGGTALTPQFTLGAATYIAELDLYQKGNSVATGQIGFRNVSTLDLFLFDTLNTAPHLYDVFTYVHYAAVGRVLAAGTYEIVNDAASTWAFNGASRGVGFAAVYAAPEPARLPLPGTLALICAGLAALGATRRRSAA